MKVELQKQLFEKYPKIFRQKDLSMKETCMCWGFECGDGWYNILDCLCAGIQNYIDNHNEKAEEALKYQAMHKSNSGKIPEWFVIHHLTETGDLVGVDVSIMPQVEAAQVKEKFGTLRFYTQGHYDAVIGALVAFAERMTECTCEQCGNPGDYQTGGWCRVICEPCDQKRQEEYEKHKNGLRNA